MTRPRRIAVVTGSRAEYGLLYWLMKNLQADSAVDLQLIVTGTHLSERFGMTVHQIRADGFEVSASVPLPVEDDSVLGVTNSLAAATVGLGARFAELKPDVLVLLGDRYEALAAAQAAMLARIPIAHIHGGEATEGLIDEAIRHAITKLSHLHFVAAEEFRQRVIQLGESPERVWTVGAAGLDNIDKLPLLSRQALEASLGIELRQPSFLVTHHPVTLNPDEQGGAMRSLLQVLDETGGTIVITGVNADTGAHALREEAERFAALHPGRVLIAESLGSLRYLSAIKHVDAVVGNSSSGLIEAPSLGTPTLDIGPRQLGRPRAPSVVHSDEDLASLREALARTLSAEHREISARCKSPYGAPGAAERISAILRAYPLEGLIMKRFHNLKVEAP
jgi:UDP-hydrolysing UDP-N-acetyl-D-glucosamine 2-epimerase